MRVDFYQLARDPAEAVVPQLAGKVLEAGQRLLVVSGDEAELDRIDAGLWSRTPASFLAHGRAGGVHDARQPILLGPDLARGNAAACCLIADGVWREADPPFERTLYLFGEARLQPARDCWRMLGTRDAVERNFWKQNAAGGWVKGP